jgi:cell division septal protein FtsQ
MESARELPKQGGIKVFFRRIQRYSFIFYILLILAFVFLLPRSEAILTKIDFLNVKKISVQTVKGEKPEYIDDDKVSEILGGYIGQNYFTFESDSLTKDLVAGSAFIKESIVSKQFPNSIVVDIVEREPFLITAIDEQSCVLLDAAAFTLHLSAYSEDENCSSLAQEYSVPVLAVEDSKLAFKENEQSSFYTVEDIWEITKVLNEYGYQVVSMKLADQILTVTVNDKRTITFSLNQSVDTQLERFIAVVGQIELDNLDFRSLDLRYKRPVLKRK